jgi:preprotein translocase subunit SecA
MQKNKKIFENTIRSLRQRSVEFNLEPCKNILDRINEIKLDQLNDTQIKDMSNELIFQARNGVPVDELLVKAFALAGEASFRVLKMRPFDVQVMAGVAMHYGTLVEMQTGEGKTLAAVAPVYLNALAGEGVHVLTFNDYLAKRDAEWMGPIYQFLGLRVGYVYEGMTIPERQMAYSCDITYLTAKESGFDYLKGFLNYKKEEIVHRPFHFAVIDEADSILIDEARIPLVIAGKTEKTHGVQSARMAEIINSLEPQVDYSTDEYERNVFLTEKGTTRVEELLHCGNLYQDKNLSLLVDINNALHAQMLLKRDVDYIVRNGKIELVDEFTGRVADKRHWPHGLQEAIEAKEGIPADTKGQIIASITLQNFIRLYPRVCGMTGTAQTAANEFLEFYGLKVVVIPTNKECIRADKPDIMFTHKEAKLEALLSEITAVNKAGRPVLIGTRSVEESEQLAGRLKDLGVACQVLNAKNDEQEARIIARAGELGAVTVSTNMAGRGTDIKLGGENEEEREKVVELGGLYVIGTNRHESSRIDNQLRGRAGRQGDPGSSQFFVSMEDDLTKQYRLRELIPESLYPEPQDMPVDNQVVRRECARAQRIIEGQNFEIRRTLSKYSILMERQRQMMYQWRSDLLTGRAVPNIMPVRLPERYAEMCSRVGVQAVQKAEKQATFYFINTYWADYLDFLSYTRESIHLVNIAGKIPLSEFNKIAIETFKNLLKDIQDEVVGILSDVEITENGIDMEKAGLKAPTSTWTYLIDDSPEQLGMKQIPLAVDPISTVLMTFGMMWMVWRQRISKKKKKLMN